MKRTAGLLRGGVLVSGMLSEEKGRREEARMGGGPTWKRLRRETFRSATARRWRTHRGEWRSSQGGRAAERRLRHADVGDGGRWKEADGGERKADVVLMVDAPAGHVTSVSWTEAWATLDQ